MGRNSVNEPSLSGVALRSSTDWFAVVDKHGETVTNRLFGSSMRAALWATEYFNTPWPELHAAGFTVRGGFHAETPGEPK
jgi:hypothetical protein